jgi:hypothetical protein
MFKHLFVQVLFAFVICANARVASIQGTWGYGHSPSAFMADSGTIVFSAQNLITTEVEFPGEVERIMQASWSYVPLWNLEVSAALRSANYKQQPQSAFPILSLKYQLPRTQKDFPILSLGFFDIANPHVPFAQIAFMAAQKWELGQGSITAEVGAIYSRDRYARADSSLAKPIQNEAYPFVAGALQWKQGTIFAEWGSPFGKSGYSYGVQWHPFYNQNNSSLWRNTSFLWGVHSVTSHLENKPQSWWINLTIGRSLPYKAQSFSVVDSDTTPILIWHYSPLLQGNIGLEQSAWRMGLHHEVELKTPVEGLVWFNHLNFYLQRNPLLDSIVKRDYWSASYMQWSPNWEQNLFTVVKAPVLMAGFIDSDTWTFMHRQSFEFKRWRRLILDWGLMMAKHRSVPLYLHTFFPLHPRMGGMFARTQIYGAGGFYKTEKAGGDLVLRQGLGISHLDVRLGFRSDQSLQIAANLTMDFGNRGQTQWGRLQVGPNPRQRFHYQAELVQQILQTHSINLRDMWWEYFP